MTTVISRNNVNVNEPNDTSSFQSAKSSSEIVDEETVSKLDARKLKQLTECVTSSKKEKKRCVKSFSFQYLYASEAIAPSFPPPIPFFLFYIIDESLKTRAS